MRAAVAVVALSACVRPAEDRAALDLDVGEATGAGLGVEIAGGLGHVRALDAGALVVWAQAPELAIALDADAAGTWTLELDNVLADAVVTGAPATLIDQPRRTVQRWELALPAGRTDLVVSPPDAADAGAWRFAAMADIQTGMPIVHEVFAAIDAEPDVRFVIFNGDITQRAQLDEYDAYEAQLQTLDVPIYATIGNHELWADPREFHDRFGRMNVHFTFRGVAFTLVDSGSATLDPTVDAWLDGWLADAADRVHIFGTHYPPLDPVGVRQGSFASEREGLRLLSRLADGGVDLTLYGHIHTYTRFENAGIPAFISGGGGAEQQRLDGVGRHFLAIDVDAERLITVRRVDVD